MDCRLSLEKYMYIYCIYCMCLSLEKDGAETDLNLHSHVDRGRNMVFYYGLSLIGLGPLFVLEINPLSRSVHGCINLIFII